jgi:two-component system nitrogen regulation sensor histidine kinase NtrY
MSNVGQAATAELAGAAGAGAPGGRLSRWLGLVAVLLALMSAVATFLVLANLTPIVPTGEVVLTLLLLNGLTILFLLAIIASEIWWVVQARRRGRAGARLHVRIVTLFSIVAAVPAILVAVVASVTLDRGLDQLFSRQTNSMIQNSAQIAEAYVRDHVQMVRADIIATAIELVRAKPLFDQNREQFHQFLTAQSGIRGLPSTSRRRRRWRRSPTPSPIFSCFWTTITSRACSSFVAITTSFSMWRACSIRASWPSCRRRART